MTTHDYLAVIGELWPNWRATTAQATEYRDRLSQKNPAWVESAIRDHYSLDCPRDGTFIEPRLSKILTRYAAISESGEHAAESQKCHGFRAAWTETRHDQPVKTASERVFRSRTEAVAYATSKGWDACAYPVGEVPKDPDEERDVMRDDRVGRFELSQWPADRLESAVAKALDGPFGLDAKSLGRPIDEWSRFEVGCVVAIGGGEQT